MLSSLGERDRLRRGNRRHNRVRYLKVLLRVESNE
jgi:hypothetical protein